MQPESDKQAELDLLDKQIELKRQELELIKVEQNAMTDRAIITGTLATLGIGLIAAIAVQSSPKPKRRSRWF